MPPPLPLQQHLSTSQTKSIHLLRALLREVSYLPDANARSFFHAYILDRFKAYQPKDVKNKHKNIKTIRKRQISSPDTRFSHAQRTAYKGLNYLRRANNGDPRPLYKVLLMAYGRVGKRRYELLNTLLQPRGVTATDGAPASSSSPTALAPLQKLYHSDKAWLKYFDAPTKRSQTEYIIRISDRYPLLRAVLVSQVKNGISLGRNLKRSALITPIRNIWERPMPVNRARNDVRRWYAFTMSRLLPHLPAKEWDTLRALVTGEAKWMDRVARRTAVGTNALSEEARSLAAIGAGIKMDRPTKAAMRCGHGNQRRISAHVMRRLYARVFSLCCKLELDETCNKWEAHWGSFSQLGLRSAPPPVDDALFAGVANNGSVLRPPRTMPGDIP